MFPHALVEIGNIRVYCRIRPFLPGQKGKQSIIEHIGDNGELTVANPTKPGKEGRRSFRFDKVYGPTSTQGFDLRIYAYLLSLSLMINHRCFKCMQLKFLRILSH